MNIRRIAGALLTPLLAGGLLIGAAQAASADNNPQPGTWSEIFAPYFNPGAAKCLDVPGGTTTTGAWLQVFHCHGYAGNGAPQRWVFRSEGQDSAGESIWEIMNLASNECLSHVAGQVIQDVCLERSAELWVEHLTPNVGPYFALSSLDFAGDCLATFNSSGADSTDVVIANCNYDNQSDPTWIRQVWSLG